MNRQLGALRRPRPEAYTAPVSPLVPGKPTGAFRFERGDLLRIPYSLATITAWIWVLFLLPPDVLKLEHLVPVLQLAAVAGLAFGWLGAAALVRRVTGRFAVDA